MELYFAVTCLGVAWGISLWQWQLWRGRALRCYQELQSHKNQIERVNLMWNNLHDERLRNHRAMMDVFDMLNDNGPFGSHNDQLMEAKYILLHAIQNSTFREK